MKNEIWFLKIKEPYGWMSNFSHHRIIDGDKTYATSEHYYQAQKAISLQDHTLIQFAKSAFEAAKFGRSILCRADWENIKVNVMNRALELKVLCNPELKTWLLATGDMPIFELSFKDNYWGTLPDKSGANMLGRCWMNLRERLKNGE